MMVEIVCEVPRVRKVRQDGARVLEKLMPGFER